MSTSSARSTTAAEWSPASWRARPARQQPSYPDDAALDAVLHDLATLPPLVTSWEANELREQLAMAANGERFLLQGGDCAERFDECRADILANRFKVLLKMSLVLVYGLNKPIVRVGRLAGQYAKPRSSDTETRASETLPSYRGDIINDIAFTPGARMPDPTRLRTAYNHSATTLNFIRALSEGGFADLNHPEHWQLGFLRHSPLASEYQSIVRSIRESLNFTQTVAEGPIPGLRSVTFYTSHEALHLPYEEAMTRFVEHQDGYYNLGTHLPWIGKRTAHPDEAHVEYMRGLQNPVALKVGPDLPASTLTTLIRHLNPDNAWGKLTLITRMGAEQVSDRLPPLLRAVEAQGAHVLWVCDPMHGNTEKTQNGYKTRRFRTILHELEQTFALHQAEGTHLGGVHFEMTGENVTECVGGARGLTEHDLEEAYTSHVDPRLNVEQALEMALSIVRMYRNGTDA